MEQKSLRAYVAELVGTFVLVFFIALVVTDTSVLQVRDFAVIGLVHVFVLGLLVASLAGVSGAHFNPAVTVTLAALRKIRGPDAAIYILMQLAGATLAAYLVKAVLLDEGRSVKYGGTLVAKAFLGGDLSGFVLEGIGTFVLLFAIVGSAVIMKNKSALTPWVIGGALGGAVMCIAPLTGAGLNPARAFGPLLAADALFDNFGTFLFVYTLGPIVGGLLAGFLVHWLYRGDVEEAQAITAAREDIIEGGAA